MTKAHQVLLSCSLFLISLPVLSVPLQNGDFSLTTDWIDYSTTGTTQIMGGEAVLQTSSGIDPYSAVLLQGDDGSFNFFNPITLDSAYDTLSFDVRFEDLGADATETGGSFFSDYLLIALYDATDFTGSSDLLFDADIDRSILSMTTYSFDIRLLAGNAIALSFELNDENDGVNTRAFIDNVYFSTAITTVPEPQALALFGLGLLGLFFTRSTQRKKRPSSIVHRG